MTGNIAIREFPARELKEIIRNPVLRERVTHSTWIDTKKDDAIPGWREAQGSVGNPGDQ